MGLMSPTVIRITGFVLLSGTIAFIVAGFIDQGEEQSTGSVLLTGVVIGGPLSAIVGVIAGIVWEKLIGPLKSVEHLDMRKRHYKTRRDRQAPPSDETDLRLDRDLARAPERTSDRRYTGKGGGKRKR